jgi:hypothetical protein
MNELKDKLITGARVKGICADGLKELHHASELSEMIDYYITNPDWCMERDFPDIDTLRAEFSDIEDKGVFVDKVFNGELLNDRQVYIFHNCTGVIKVALNVEKAIAPMLYFANGCRLKIVGTGDAKPRVLATVPLYIFGDNKIVAQHNWYVRFAPYHTNIKHD